MRSGLQQNVRHGGLLGGLLVLTCSVQFGFGLAGGAAALLGAAGLGVGMTLLWLHFELTASRAWVPPAVLTGAVLFSTLVLELLFKPDFTEWFAPLLAGLASGATLLTVLRNRKRCNLCSRRLSPQDLTFRCPRCTQQVCEQTCWNFEHRRCELCLEQRVPMLPLENTWWTRVAGPRMTQGKCQVCQAGAAEAELQACPRCRRPQCRNCWDFQNGECARCGGALPDLPAALENVIGSGLQSEQAYRA